MADIVLPKWGETQDATEYIQRICDHVKPAVEKLTGKTYEVFNAVKYRISCDTNYLIKVHAGVEDYVHLSVFEIPLLFRGFPSPIDILKGVEQGRTKDDSLLPFVNTFGRSSSSGSE